MARRAESLIVLLEETDEAEQDQGPECETAQHNDHPNDEHAPFGRFHPLTFKPEGVPPSVLILSRTSPFVIVPNPRSV